MSPVTYRKAAEIAGCAVSTVQWAVKSGALAAHQIDGKKKLDYNAVCFWGFLRNRHETDVYIVESMHRRWMDACAQVVEKLLSRTAPRVKRTGLDNEDIDIVKNEIFNFFKVIISWDLQYLYSEKIYFPENNVVKFNKEIDILKFRYLCKEDEINTVVDGLTGDIDFRCDFSVMNFVRDNLLSMERLIGSLGIYEGVHLQDRKFLLNSILLLREELKNRGIKPQFKRSK